MQLILYRSLSKENHGLWRQKFGISVISPKYTEPHNAVYNQIYKNPQSPFECCIQLYSVHGSGFYNDIPWLFSDNLCVVFNFACLASDLVFTNLIFYQFIRLISDFPVIGLWLIFDFSYQLVWLFLYSWPLILIWARNGYNFLYTCWIRDLSELSWCQYHKKNSKPMLYIEKSLALPVKERCAPKKCHEYLTRWHLFYWIW